jgi:hypothetical protein
MGKLRWQDLDEYDRAGDQKIKRRTKLNEDDDSQSIMFDVKKKIKTKKR